MEKSMDKVNARSNRVKTNYEVLKEVKGRRFRPRKEPISEDEP